MGAICLPQDGGNDTFEVTGTTFHLLQMRGVYRGLDNEYPHEILRNFTVVCDPFSLKDVSQESTWLW